MPLGALLPVKFITARAARSEDWASEQVRVAPEADRQRKVARLCIRKVNEQLPSKNLLRERPAGRRCWLSIAQGVRLMFACWCENTVANSVLVFQSECEKCFPRMPLPLLLDPAVLLSPGVDKNASR